MKSLRVKLAAGVAVLGLAGVGTAAIAHDRSRFDASLTGYEEVPTLSTQGVGSFQASINRGRDEIRYTLSYRGPFDAQRGRERHPGAHPSRRAGRQRRHHRVPVQQPRQRPGGDAGVSGRGGQRERDDHARAGDRAGDPGHRARRVRRARACAARRRGLRQRPHDDERGRRDPRPDRRRRRRSRRPPLSPPRAPAQRGRPILPPRGGLQAHAVARTASRDRDQLRPRADDRVLSRRARVGDRPRRALRRRSRRPPRVVRRPATAPT